MIIVSSRGMISALMELIVQWRETNNKHGNKCINTKGGMNRGLSLPEEPALKLRLRG